MRELFVWYRVRAERVEAARASVAAMQGELVARWPDLRARCLVRRDAGFETWMETYAAAKRGGVDAEIEAAIAAAARPLAAFIDGERHVEAFDAADSS